MNTQQNQNEIKKKGVQVNPSRDIDYGDKEKAFSGEFEGKEGEQIDEDSNVEINPSELDNSEVELDRGGVEFSGGNEGQQKNASVQNAGKSGAAQGYNDNSPQAGMSSDLGGDKSRLSGQAKGSDMGNRQGTQKTSDQTVKKGQDDSMRQ